MSLLFYYRRLPWLLLLLLVTEGTCDYRDAFEYPFITPRHPAPVRSYAMAPGWKQFYPENYDFTDYSRHITRSDPASRNSAAQQIPSGPYFAQELKRYYHKPAAEEHKVYQTSWNMIDSEGNEYSTVYNRPGMTGHRPSPPSSIPLPTDQYPFVLDAWQQQQQQQHHAEQQQPKERPTRKPISKKPVRKKNKVVRPIHPGMTTRYIRRDIFFFFFG